MKRILVFAASLALVSFACAQSSLTGTQPATIQLEAAPAAAPGISFKETTHEFGQIPVGKPVTFRYEFTNTGKADLLVSNAKPGCGCTTPTWTKTAVKPGETGYVDATYNAAGVGPFTKTVTVESNAGTPVILYLKGEVKAADAPVPVAAPAPLPAAGQ